MSKNYRLRTTPGIDKNIRIKIDQDFDFIEILSLKLKQSDLYTRFCADYGVIAGRPLSNEDDEDPVISTLYPYKTLTDKNEDGYRYNLLPYVQEYGGHNPTGTFPDREDVLTRSEVLEVYEKYYKYTARTNDSGDFMIVGVPLGQQIIIMDADLSNIGCFSLRPSDLIRMGMGSEGQFDGPSFRSSTDLDSLPQIINQKKEVEVASFWGEEDLCNIGITRVDFDLRDSGIKIEPQAIFMGSIFSTTDEDALQSNCKPKFDSGNLCDLVTAPGRILAIRQTIYSDAAGLPILEQHNLDQGGNIIDNEGTWLTEVPMNLDYVTTNEFGEQILSNDPTVGIPTKAKYRFKIQYQNESFGQSVQRAEYLVPNIREYGWNSTTNANGPSDDTLQRQSYAFSLDWTDYGNTGTTIGQKMIRDAINCEDKFFEFNYNRVYTVSGFIDRWKWGFNRARHMGIKEITNRECSKTTNRMPVNDGVRNFDLLFFLFNIIITIFGFLVYVLVPLLHLIALFWPIAKWAIAIGVPLFLGYLTVFFFAAGVTAFPAIGLMVLSFGTALVFALATAFFIIKVSPLILATQGINGINLPSMAYPECEACSCETTNLELDEIIGDGTSGNLTVTTIRDQDIFTRKNSSFLSDVNSNNFWSNAPDESNCPENGCDDSTNFCGIRTDEFGGNQQTKINKYNLNSYGIRYALAGYPNLKVVGTPINRLFFPEESVVFIEDITYAQRLNLANIRQRYFDRPGVFFSQNIIKTKIENDGYYSDEFTDNVMVLMCDPNTIEQLPAGSLLSFVNPENINDNNINGYNVSGVTENQLGTNSITGTSSLFKQISLEYITENATTAYANITITGSTTERPYRFKGGVEYFQVITGMTVNDAFNLTTSSNMNYMRYFFLDTRQKIVYRKSCDGNPTESIVNPLKSTSIINQAWSNFNIVFLVRGVDPFSEKQVIKYDLSRLFGRQYNNITIKGNYYLNVPIQPNSGGVGADWWINDKTPESHEVFYTDPSQKLYYSPFNFRPDPNLYSGFTTNSIKYYSSLDKKSVEYGGFKAWNSDGYSLDKNLSNPPLKVLAFNDNSQTYLYNNGLSDFYGGNQEQKYRVPFITGSGSYSQTYQGNVEGGSFLYTNFSYRNTLLDFIYNPPGGGGGSLTYLNEYLNGQNAALSYGNNNNTYSNDTTDRRPRLFSPSYSVSNSSLSAYIDFDTTPAVDNAKLIIRSDRLPTSDNTQRPKDNNGDLGNSSFVLFQNDNFAIYRILDSGEVIPVGNTSTDQTGNSDDFAEDANSGSTSVLATFSCEGMVPLDCYSGTGENFGIKTPCADNENPTRITRGCYKLIQKPYFRDGSVKRDIKNFQEWKTRFRFTFGACRGVISHVFQNNWVNGSLYSFAFKKKTIFNSNNEPVNNIFCGGKSFDLIPVRPNQGPIYLNENTNTFYYRSTPYVLQQNGTNVTGYFIGQEPRFRDVFGTWKPIKDLYGRGSNDRNLFFPTTVMDLGPRDQFAKEICLNPQLENYLVETINSTSFNDTSDLLLLFILSRLTNSNVTGQLFNTGDASIDALFSRTDKRIDGDLAQLFSINSEYGIVPFNEQFYENGDIVLGYNNENFLGILFSSTTVNRIAMTPGTATFGNVQQLVGYPKTQEVPMYNWEIREPTGNGLFFQNSQASTAPSTIFGSQYNNWLTSIPTNTNKMYSIPYQKMSFNGADYFKATNGPSTGFIFNYNNLGERDFLWTNPSNQNKANFVVGAPYHFYFGLGKGKTALNRFISKYIIGG